eukprot:gene47828-58595_t
MTISRRAFAFGALAAPLVGMAVTPAFAQTTLSAEDREALGLAQAYLRGLTAAQVQRLNAAIKRAMETPAVVKALEDRGLEPRWSTSAELAARLKADMQKWQPIA